MVKQRGARIPWLFALCPADLALFHLMERSILSSPIRPSDLAGFEHLSGHYLVRRDGKIELPSHIPHYSTEVWGSLLLHMTETFHV